MHTYIHTYINTYVCVYIYIYIYHIYIYIYAYIHTYIHTYLGAGGEQRQEGREDDEAREALHEDRPDVGALPTPNLPTKIIPAKIARFKLSRRFPTGLGSFPKIVGAGG